MATMTIRFLATFLLLLFQKEASANRIGAGSCAAEMAAVSGDHLDTTGGRPVRLISLVDVGIVMQIGTTVLDESVVNDFPVGQDFQISVTATGPQYKGVLVRLEAPMGVNTVAALMPGTNTAISTRCVSPIIGITHTGNGLKSTSTGTIRFDTEVLDVMLDITVVLVNDSSASIYGYSAFKVNFRGAPIPPPTPPAPAPVAPVMGMGRGMGGGMSMGW